MRNVLWAIGLLPLLVLAAIGFRYLIRGTPIRRVHRSGPHGQVGSVADEEFTDVVELLGKVSLRPGNEVTFTRCGDETYPRLWEDLRSARRSITLQMYYCKMGAVSDQLAAIITERAQAGVKVLFLLDAFGAQDLTEAYLQRLTDAGVTVRKFRPVQWYAVEKAYNRSHIRVVTVDGLVGWTGGFGLDDKWLGDGRTVDQWRDTNVRFTGPAVRDLQATFAAGWAEATGELLAGDLWFAPCPPIEKGVGVQAGVMHAAPTMGSTVAERFLALAMSGARQTLYIANAYFVPDDDFCGLLAEAARRGVDTRILTAGPLTDTMSTLYAGRARYEELLAAGVRMFEYQPTMMHAKTLVVDACFGSAGTMNFDNRSMAFNDETNLVFLDGNLGRQLHQIFLEDLMFAREITLEEFRRRPAMERIKERGARLIARIL